MTQKFERPSFEMPDQGVGNEKLQLFLRSMIEKTQRAFDDLESDQLTRRPGGNIYALSGTNTSIVYTVSGSATATATSTDPALYQLLRELKTKGMIR